MKEDMLRKTLWADLWGSAVSVVVTVAGAGVIARWLDVSVWAPVTVGVVLIPWVIFLAHTVRQTPLQNGKVLFIVGGNLAWVVVAAVLIIGFPDALSTSGKWIVGVFSAAVLDLAVLEWFGLRAQTSPAPATSVIQSS